MTLDTESILLISGPTAVGKTDLALALARSLGGEIVNIDSVQLYRGLDIGSAKPTAEERARAPHHLFELFSPGEQGTVARYVEAALGTVAELRSRKKLPIFVGGTGLYVTALLQGLAQLPRVDPDLRAKLESRSTDELRAELVERDDESAATISVNDRTRTIRALETVLLSGSKASDLRSAHGHRTDQLKALTIIPLIDRDVLYRRINERTDRMIAAGLVEEVARVQRDFGEAAPALDAIGYRETAATLRGELQADRLSETIALNTRRFAKRQMTFWRNEPRKRGWRIRPDETDPAIMIGGTSAAKRAPVKPIAALALNGGELTEEIRRCLSQPLERSEVWFVAAGPQLAS